MDGVGVILVFITNPLVLLVEDSAIALHLIKTIVKQAGLSYLSATDGESALTLAKSNAFDLIITDIGLPGISGYELTRTVREWDAHETKNTVPIIGLTALSLFEATKPGLEAGMNTVLCKPINLEKLKALIAQYLD